MRGARHILLVRLREATCVSVFNGDFFLRISAGDYYKYYNSADKLVIESNNLSNWLPATCTTPTTPLRVVCQNCGGEKQFAAWLIN